MNSFVAPEIQWAALSPILVVVGAAILGVVVATFVPKTSRRTVQVFVALAAPLVALVLVAWRWSVVVGGGESTLVAGQLAEDGPTLAIQMVLCLVALVGFAVMASRLPSGEEAFAPQGAAAPGSPYEEAARKAGLEQTEVFPLALFSLAGMLVFPMANDLLVLFVALEVLSLPLYVLTALARRRRVLSQEASLKYFLLGAFSSALFLFGVALLYGFSGSLGYADLGTAAEMTVGMDGMAVIGFLLVLVGLLFKVGAVPFHAWVPDVYQGAPTPVTGFMAAATKTAAFGAILRLLYVAAPGFGWDLEPVLWTVAIASMLVGTVLAIVQTDIKRILAYSSVAHAGFALVAIATLSPSGPSSLIFYLLAYGLATVGAFAVITLVRERDAEGNVTGEATHLSQWAGLGRRHPVLAGMMTLFLLSFTGIPLTAGFVGKFVAFVSAVEGGAWPLVVVAVVASAAAAFFYVRIIVLMFFTEPEESERPGSDAVTPGALTGVALWVCAIATVVLGVWPTPVLDLLAQAAKFVV
ncbi:NADH dehydrogenase subunit N [Salana multivorans]|uniref:NADH-quinone oxidoreductase subunit N n=1 Tax=Salana multivorans TaxID=120377 RepID=A0A3N2D8F4_9MICO|nr:NADH-quinone oxidoreductase subunit NuoN [Salana multivorans]MBN8882762.1 NADH-quinone oxidoreductase subunit NuoN [Salana multivorans]OJX93846.1 MAG: NADH-quinone oxidoreductase subunit N [Micrococcales bacterium 73-15]ROR96063.1 NADH dehydrogenase subunit N [Salana multivorans]